jgi:hypothetical protein
MTQKTKIAERAALFPPCLSIPQFNCRLPKSVKADIRKLKKDLGLNSQGEVVARAIRAYKAERKDNRS